MQDYPFKTAPFAHQRECLDISWEREEYALLLEQGTGKSKIVTDNAAALYLKDRIECLVIIAPNGVHRKWVREDIPLSLPDCITYKYAVWQSQSTKAERAIEELYKPGKYLRI